MTRRGFAWFLLFCTFIALIVRVIQLHIYPDERIIRLIDSGGVSKSWSFPARGKILDAKGDALALSLPVTSIYFDSIRWNEGEAESNVKKLKGLLPDKTLSMLSKPQKGNFIWLKRQMDPSKAKVILDKHIEGIYGVRENKRFYPNGKLLSHVLGFCDIDGKGLAGLELRLNDILYVPYREIFQVEKKVNRGVKDKSFGGTVKLSIDRRIQYVIEKHLASASLENKASWGAAVCVESNTGRIVAMASWPDYDANDRGSLKIKKKLKNNCIGRVYEPGSTFKPIIVAIALQSGLVNTRSSFIDKGRVRIADGWISNSSRVGRGKIKLSESLMYSSNVAMALIGLKFNPYETYKDLKAWGLNVKTNIELSGEEEGLLLPPERWYGVIPSNIAIGQGIAVTPLQLVMSFNAIANGGFLLRPHIIDSVQDHSGTLLYKANVDVIREVLSSTYVNWFRKTLRDTVTDGTGKKANTSVAKVAGKTGTAQIARSGKYLKKDMVASFIGFWPYDSPKYTLLVVIGEPQGRSHYGGQVAAPVFKDMVEDIERLHISDED